MTHQTSREDDENGANFYEATVADPSILHRQDRVYRSVRIRRSAVASGRRLTLQLSHASDGEHLTPYPIGNTANREQIVANIAAIVDELDRTFVPEIEAVVDPAPQWFDSGRE